MYLTSLHVEQVGEASGLTCPVLVEWNYGDRLPSVVEIYADDTRIEQLTVSNSKDPVSVTVSLRAGAVVKVSVCPRLLEDDVLQDQMPDSQGNDQYWESFCLVQNITTKGKAGTGEVSPKPPKLAPIITSVEAIPASVQLLQLPGMPARSSLKQRGKIRVSWIASNEFDSFLVLWRSNYDQWSGANPERRWNSNKYAPVGGQREVEEGGKSGSFVLDGVMPELEYEFSVKGRDSGFLGLDPTYSDWSSPVKFVAQKNLTSLRQYLRVSSLNEANGIRQYLFADGGSLRAFMQLQ